MLWCSVQTAALQPQLVPSVCSLVRELVLQLVLYGHEPGGLLAVRVLRWAATRLVLHALRGHLDAVDCSQLAAFGQQIAGQAADCFCLFPFCFVFSLTF